MEQFPLAVAHRKLGRINPLPWCESCPLNANKGFSPFSVEERDFISAFKIGHQRAWAGESLLSQSSSQPRLFTIFSGWAAKFRSLAGGSRQLINVLLPGDLVGVEGSLTGQTSYGVEAITDVTMCMFDPRKIDLLMADRAMAVRMLVIMTEDLRRTMERLAVIGACDGRRNLAHFIGQLHMRLLQLNMSHEDNFKFPLTLRQLAEGLGLTTVHLHRILRDLKQEDILHIDHGHVYILSVEKLRKLGMSTRCSSMPQPFL